MIVGIFLVLSIASQAASIARVGSEQLVGNAELIFQGQVTERHAVRASTGKIYTYVDFLVVDVLKGELSDNSLRLRFTGGEIDGLGLDAGAIIPAVGEQGIYFVESVDRKLINPLYGWAQGHFTINDKNQVEAANGDLVTEVVAASSPIAQLSNGVAEGFSTSLSRSAAASRALTPEEFIARIGQMLDTMTDDAAHSAQLLQRSTKPRSIPPKPIQVTASSSTTSAPIDSEEL